MRRSGAPSMSSGECRRPRDLNQTVSHARSIARSSIPLEDEDHGKRRERPHDRAIEARQPTGNRQDHSMNE